MAPMNDYRELEDTVATWAREAGALALELERGHGTLRYKAGREAVTDADGLIEIMLRERIATSFPGDAVVGEEMGAGAGADTAARVWHLDPIDGTLNYALGLPDFCISIALFVDGEPRTACIHQPIGGDMWTASRNEGTRRNGESVTVGKCRSLADAMVSVQPRKRGRLGRDPHLLQALLLESHKFRKVGAIALEMAWTAAGAYDGLIIASRGAIPFHDVAAGILLISEAGGVITDGRGQPYRRGGHELVAGNAAVHRDLLELLGRFPEPG